MPRRTYSSKNGRRRPNPEWANFEWLVSELLRINNRHAERRARGRFTKPNTNPITKENP